MVCCAFILGSSYGEECRERWALARELVTTSHGEVVLWRVGLVTSRRVYVLFRHGIDHRYLPNQIPYRAHAEALAKVGVQALLITSSVGVLDATTPLGTLMLVSDVLMPDNRLPDGSACTMFTHSMPGQGHLVLEEGLCSRALGAQVRECASTHEIELAAEEVVFAYVGGPRTKTRAENSFWRQVGAQVNSMTLAPEMVLANELEIPCAALVVGHKRSSGKESSRQRPDVEGAASVTRSLERSRHATDTVLEALFEELEPVDFANHIYRF